MLPRLFKILIVAATTGVLSPGCAVHTPGGHVVVDPDRTHSKHPHDDNFCPPGQAKKGRC